MVGFNQHYFNHVLSNIYLLAPVLVIYMVLGQLNENRFHDSYIQKEK